MPFLIRSILLLGALVHAVAASAFEISGLITDVSAQPVKGAAVWLRHASGVLQATSDSAGRYAISDVSIGEIELVAYKEGHALGGAAAIVTGPGEINLFLGKEASLEVRLIQRNTGPGGDLPPTNVAGARLKSLTVGESVYVAVDELSDHGFPSFRSGDDGWLRVPCLPDGGYVAFTVSHRNYTDTIITYYPVGRQPLTVPMVRGVEVEGRVANAEDEGVADARVVVFQGTKETLQKIFEGVSDSDGYFSARLRPGRYLVAARHSGYATSFPKPVEVPETGETVEVDLELPRGRMVTGRVTLEDGSAAPGVQVGYVKGEHQLDATYSDNAGAFRILADEGKCLVRLRPPDGYVIEPTPVLPIEVTGDTFSIDRAFLMRPLPLITGSIVDAEGNPAAHSIIASMNMREPVTATAHDDGTFELQLKQMPEDGTARFLVEHPLRFQRTQADVNVTSKEPLRIVMAPFEPDLSPCVGTDSPNNLGRLRDDPAPAIACDAWFNLQDGSQSINLESLRGKVVVLTFWGGFDQSGPGRNRLKEMNLLYDIYGTSGDVAIVGIHDSGNEKEEIDEFIRNYGIRFPVGRDAETKTFTAYDILVIPQTVLIDKKGVLRFFDVNGRLLELVKALRRESE
ncbi:MAG: hypothetical protein AMXMBFR84_46290 [Candidatus Hydrogenedentota bacterium]